MDSDTKKAIDEYYKLKNEYETKIGKLRKKIRNDKSLSKQEKRRKMLEIVPKCANCGKPGGTKFSINKTILRAVCGNTSDPCRLNIEINRGGFEHITSVYNFLQKESEQYKEDIIRAKLDLLFNYESEEQTVALFNELRTGYSTVDESIMLLQEKFDNIILGKRNKEEIVEAVQNIYGFKKELSVLAKEYAETGEEQLITDMVEKYVGDIRPEVEKLRGLKYPNSMIECDDGEEYMGACDDDIRRLIQEPYTMEETEVTLLEEPTVIANSK